MLQGSLPFSTQIVDASHGMESPLALQISMKHDKEIESIMNPIGILQGHLLSSVRGSATPGSASDWGDEFQAAKMAGVDFIEWIYDDNHLLDSDDGVVAIRNAIQKHGVPIRSVRANYFITHPLVLPDGQCPPSARERLEWLLKRVSPLSVAHIVLPFLESASVSRLIQFESLTFLMQRLAPIAEAAGVALHLKTDLPPSQVAELVHVVQHPSVQITYDPAGSASLGYDPTVEISTYGPSVGSVHLTHQAENLPFPLQILQKTGYLGPFTLESVEEHPMVKKWLKRE